MLDLSRIDGRKIGAIASDGIDSSQDTLVILEPLDLNRADLTKLSGVRIPLPPFFRTAKRSTLPSSENRNETDTALFKMRAHDRVGDPRIGPSLKP